MSQKIEVENCTGGDIFVMCSNFSYPGPTRTPRYTLTKPGGIRTYHRKSDEVVYFVYTGSSDGRDDDEWKANFNAANAIVEMKMGILGGRRLRIRNLGK